MILTSTKLVIELQFYFYKFLMSSSLNKNEVPFPTTFDDSYLIDNHKKSFIRLLFDDTYIPDSTSFNYLYIEVDKESWPQFVKNRLCIYPVSGKYYIPDSTGENLFNLKTDDLLLLTRLLQFRITGTINISDIDYNILSTKLSKMIYLYLDLKVNRNYLLYDNTDIISETMIEHCFEVYLTEHMFKNIS